MYNRTAVAGLVIMMICLLTGAQLAAQPPTSSSSIDQLVKRLEGAKQDTDKVKLLDQIASFYSGNDRQKSLLYANRELELSQGLGWIKGQLMAYYQLGGAYSTSNDYIKSITIFTQGYQLAQKNHLPDWQHKILLRIGFMNLAMKDDGLALQHFNQVSEYYQHAGRGEKWSESKVPNWFIPAYYIGRIYYKQKKDAESLRYFEQILQSYKQQKDSLGTRAALFLFFRYEQSKGELNYGKALPYAFEALTYFRKGDTTNMHGSFLVEIANIYKTQKDYVQALEYYRAAIRLKPESDISIRSAASTGMRQIYSVLGDHAQALQLDRERLADASSLNKANNMEMLFLYKDLSEDYLQLKQFDLALSSLRKALQLSGQLGEPSLHALVLGSLANAYYLTQQYDEAFRTVKESLAVETQNDFVSNFTSRYLGIIIRDAPEDVLRKWNIQPAQRYQLAIKNLQLSLSYFNQGYDPAALQDCYKELSKTYEMMGDYQQFYHSYKRYISLRDSSINRTNQNAFIGKLSEMRFEKREDSLKYQQSITTERLTQQTRLTAQQRTYYLSGMVALLALSFFIARNYYNQRRSNKLISAEKQRSDDLLLNILPADVAEELKQKGSAGARQFEDVTVLFTDFVNFTAISELLTPQELVDELHTCFMAFDEIISRHGIEKIKTIGDAYLAVAGLPNKDIHHAQNTVMAALEIRRYIHQRKALRGNRSFEIRIGIHSGSVVAGIVGVKKFAYDIWGDTVNTAARMEQHSLPGQINLSEKTYELVKTSFAFTYRGEIEAKNKGALKMYFVEEQVLAEQS